MRQMREIRNPEARASVNEMREAIRAAWNRDGLYSICRALEEEDSPGGCLRGDSEYPNPALAINLARLLCREPKQVRAALSFEGWKATPK